MSCITALYNDYKKLCQSCMKRWDNCDDNQRREKVIMKSAFDEPIDFGNNPNQVTFGKYKGVDIKDVPVEYIEWFIRESDPNTTRYKQFKAEYERRTTPPAKPEQHSEEPQTVEQPTENLMVFSKKTLEELIASAFNRGYGEAYRRMAVNIRAIPNMPTFYVSKFKQELLESLQQNRPIDVTKFAESKKTENLVGGEEFKTAPRRPWHAEDHRV